MHKIEIPVCAEAIMNVFRDHGFESYAVGGCVRDSLLGKTPHDWDFTTSATPDDMLHICAIHGIRVIETGIKHGTLTLSMFDEQYEFTTFRIDGDYSDNRHPDEVKFTTKIEDDLSRRDFTINAMAYSPSIGLVDPFGGRLDLDQRRIRCVGSPEKRFQEDALRILRALRFASTYNMGIDSDTSKEIHRQKSSLLNISVERIQAELKRLLMGENVLDILLEYHDVITTIIPELGPCVGFNQHNRYHNHTVYDHIAYAVSNYKGNDVTVKLALLLHDVGKPLCYTEDEKGGHFHGHGVPSSKIANEVLGRLNFDNKTRDAVTELVLYHDATIEPGSKVVRRWLNKIGEERFRQLLDVRMADILAHAPDTQSSRIERCNFLRQFLNATIESQQCFQMKDLAVNGKDIMALGVAEGKLVGDILKSLLSGVIEGELPNEKQTLISAAEVYLDACEGKI